MEETQEKERQDKSGLCTELEHQHGTATSKDTKKDNFMSKFKECNIVSTIPFHKCSGRTQVLYKAHVLYFHGHVFFSLEIAKKCFFVLYFLKNLLFKWVEYLFQVFIYNTKIGEL